MDRRPARIERLGPVAAARFQEQRPGSSGFVRGVLLFLVAAVPTGVQADNPKTGKAVNIMWRFDGNGRFPNIHPPSQWRRDKNILWKTPVDIGGYSSPIVARGKVFVTAEMGSLVCLDAIRPSRWSRPIRRHTSIRGGSRTSTT
jgi:outer membrane protein assembly factor BamB